MVHSYFIYFNDPIQNTIKQMKSKEVKKMLKYQVKMSQKLL